MLVQPMVMTGGGPSNSTYTVVYDIYETGTVNWEIGLASTMAIVFAFFVMILTVIQTIATRDKEDQNVNKSKKNNWILTVVLLIVSIVVPVSGYLDAGKLIQTQTRQSLLI